MAGVMIGNGALPLSCLADLAGFSVCVGSWVDVDVCACEFVWVCECVCVCVCVCVFAARCGGTEVFVEAVDAGVAAATVAATGADVLVGVVA
mmetsp:Transcript_4347/g.7050  ORF Transcript_4347/g.7050 Transcript_4347/m.7050 type:complete len:92 (+) Transcript_4347:697-972(+)